MKNYALILLVLFSFSSTFSQNWPTIGGNNQRNGLSEITGPDSVINPIWNVTAAQTVIGNSIFTFGDKFVTARAVFSPYTSKLECRSLIDGSLIWEKMVYPTSIMYTVGFNEDAVYAHDYSNDTLYALSPIDGSVKWAVDEYMFGGNSGILFACNGDPIVRGKRLDKNTGQTIWFYDYIVPVGPNAGYAATNTTFYHYSGTINTPKKLFALDIETGQFKYESIDLPGDGDQEWPVSIGNDGTIYLKRDGGKLYAFEDTGSELAIKWEYTPTSEMSGYFGSDLFGNIYVIDSDTVKLLSNVDGTVLYKSSISIQSSFYPNISVDGEGKVYVNNNTNQMFCFSANLQTVIWQMSIPNLTYCGPALSKDGTLVIAGSGVNIKAYKTNKPLAPVADFRVDSTNIYSGQSLNFYDQSSFIPTSWQWNFPGGTPSTSTDQNPQNIFYNNPGIYEVSLIATNSLGTDTMTKQCYIEVEQTIFVEDELNSPTEFYLFQNYPNPFNPTTTIIWFQPIQSNVTISIYDILGNEVETICDRVMTSGTHSIDFSAKDLPSGIYFYKILAGNFISTKKMILLK